MSTPVDARGYLNWEAVTLETSAARDSPYLDHEPCLYFKKVK
jgi:hypothetical protein